MHLSQFSRHSFLRHLPLLATTLLIGGGMQLPLHAETIIQCDAPGGFGATFSNQATSTYNDGANAILNGISGQVSAQVTVSGALGITAQGIKDKEGKWVYGLGTVAQSIKTDLVQLGFTEDEALQGSVAAVNAIGLLPADASIQQVVDTVKSSVNQTVPNQAATIARAGGTIEQNLALDVMGLGSASLNSIGITGTEQQVIYSSAIATLNTNSATSLLSEITKVAYTNATQAVPNQATLLTTVQQSLATDFINTQAKKSIPLKTGDFLRFEFALKNTGAASITLQTPTIATIQQTGLTGKSKVTAINVEGSSPTPASITIAPGQQVKLQIDTELGEIPTTGSGIAMAFGGTCGGGIAAGGTVILPPPIVSLIDPFGRITGCDGEILPDYRGFSVALYRPLPGDNTGEVDRLLPLPQTEVPDIANNNIPAGLEPNDQNNNPFFLVNGDEGKYNFLMTRNQLKKGAVYILVVKPPEDSGYDERRVRIEIGDRTAEGFAYRATSLDGRPISATNRQNLVTGTLRVSEATQVGLVLALIDLDTGVCQSQAIQIIKTGDRATAEPGDTVIYRLLVRNLSTTDVNELSITDTLPLGFDFINDSVRAEIAGRSTGVTTTRNGSTLTFQLASPLPENGIVNLAYAAQLTPDSIRGTGRNSASARGRRKDNNWIIRDGPSIHQLRIEPGILADCGTILGRVFEDKNFDGEQQPGEPGIPNAVIYMDDGNRITTDAEGLFSVANVLPGYRTGALDLTSLPGYTLAPNTRFIERNSPSRLVHLAPGAMVRMNFAVTPTFQEGTP
jgi:uncharacterized repeat protein (TIGR01451 family)